MLFNKSKFDYIVAGLGNPGVPYQNTRHNAGFMAVDRLLADCPPTKEKERFKAQTYETVIEGKNVLVIKPLTFMNLSGEAVCAAMRFYKIPTDKLIVLFDDISLPIGRVRVRPSGSCGGHNGMRNIGDMLSTEQIVRVKIGVGEKPNPQYDLTKWVLAKFTDDEKELLSPALDKAAAAVKTIIKKDVETARSLFNGA
ncbi:MAG: aminoacyl-tRNA hydrolase [Oscillospiraceae bacterium]|nr:aminoacyl-tRNA hydrolase [Candidatus Equicaccousia limihippi]